MGKMQTTFSCIMDIVCEVLRFENNLFYLKKRVSISAKFSSLMRPSFYATHSPLFKHIKGLITYLRPSYNLLSSECTRNI